MKRISIRLPEDLIAAYDDADGTRSAVMRRRLSEAVRDGEVSGVDADLRTLVEAEDAKDRARLARRRGSFRERCHSFYREKWSSGLVTPSDAEDMAESWEAEAALYGAPYVAFVDAVIAWYRDRWTPEHTERPEFPRGSTFLRLAEPEDVDVPGRLVESVRDQLADGTDPEAVKQKLEVFHPADRAQEAVRRAKEAGDVGT